MSIGSTSVVSVVMQYNIQIYMSGSSCNYLGFLADLKFGCSVSMLLAGPAASC